jgi:hypothetical protein
MLGCKLRESERGTHSLNNMLACHNWPYTQAYLCSFAAASAMAVCFYDYNISLSAAAPFQHVIAPNNAYFAR